MNRPAGGRFVWSELMTEDLERAKDFYGKVIGWGTMPFEESDSGYTLWTVDGTPVGGLMLTPDEAGGSQTFWMHYIDTPDVDATCARIPELGGAVHVKPREIPSVGRFAVVSDPQGAIFALLTPSMDGESAPPTPDHGTFVWYELGTSTDPDSAFGFYEKVFDWQKTQAMDMGSAGMYQMFRAAGGEDPVGGIYQIGAEQPGQPAWIGYMSVLDIDAAARKIAELGGTVLFGPNDVPGGRALTALDPMRAFSVSSW